MQNQTANKIIITGPDYEKFLSDNIKDNKLDFSVLVPIPDHCEEKYETLVFKHLDTDNLFFSYEMHDSGFYFKPSHGFWKLTNKFPYKSFHDWTLENWGTCVNNPEVNLEFIDNGVIVRFLSYYGSPMAWSLNLAKSYPGLNFDCYSLSSRGVLGHEYSDNGEMRIFVNDYLKDKDLDLLDCSIFTPLHALQI
jgi:hypothetical protein